MGKLNRNVGSRRGGCRRFLRSCRNRPIRPKGSTRPRRSNRLSRCCRPSLLLCLGKETMHRLRRRSAPGQQDRDFPPDPTERFAPSAAPTPEVCRRRIRLRSRPSEKNRSLFLLPIGPLLHYMFLHCGRLRAMTSSRFFFALVCLTTCLGCSSGDEPDRDVDGTGETGVAGGPGGKADDGSEDPSLQLPSGCAPSDMRFACNPVTNEGCDTDAGEACEYGLEDYFTCYPAPNDVEEGGACDWEQGPYCAPSLTCDSGVCRRHCCSDDDCAAPQRCEASSVEFGALGVCQ